VRNRNLFLNKTTVQIFMAWFCFLYFNIEVAQQDCCVLYSCSCIIMSYPQSTSICNKLSRGSGLIQSYSTLLTTNNTEPDFSELRALHSLFIKELYRDRRSPVVPFDRSLILYSCTNCLDRNKWDEFLKQWGSKGGIYIIEYKYDPFIYYIGRSNLFKRRFYNHLKAESNTKLHTFLSLVGWEHFSISIIEDCSPKEQGARENYYLQEYLPLLNTTFSSSFSETAIYESLKSKLTTLKLTQDNIKGQAVPIYAYEINDKGISKIFVKYKSITEASEKEKVARGTLGIFWDTNVPFRNKLYLSKPIKDFESTFNLVKDASKDLNLNSNIAIKVWAYNAKTLELIKGSPFPSKHQASVSIGINREVISYFIDTWKAEGVKGTYLFSRQLSDEEIEKLIKSSESLQLGKKVEVWAYNAKTLDLINDSPFSSLLHAADYFKVNYRTIRRSKYNKSRYEQRKYKSSSR
jgi:group I intron endonuclease